ncbi:hypothetical protein Amal_03731 [Acetobacter malorum]|uniref:Uncharacterized protein n=1 Tax=Acetobacter malorum TaxID=178901 RepID=A0A177G473_9PROT|nr:hypothetical protein Amal_03731 [Acetobacter malorum]
MFSITQQRGQTGGAVKPWQAQPVYGAVTPGQCRSVTIPQQSVVFNGERKNAARKQVVRRHTSILCRRRDFSV